MLSIVKLNTFSLRSLSHWVRKAMKRCFRLSKFNRKPFVSLTHSTTFPDWSHNLSINSLKCYQCFVYPYLILYRFVRLQQQFPIITQEIYSSTSWQALQIQFPKKQFHCFLDYWKDSKAKKFNELCQHNKAQYQQAFSIRRSKWRNSPSTK